MKSPKEQRTERVVYVLGCALMGPFVLMIGAGILGAVTGAETAGLITPLTVLIATVAAAWFLGD